MTPYGAGVILPSHLDEPDALATYRGAVRRVTGRSRSTFGRATETGLTGLIGHLSVWCRNGITELDLPQGGILVLDAWDGQPHADVAYSDTIIPRLMEEGIHPTPITSLGLMGYMAASAQDLGRFSEQEAYAHLAVTPTGMLVEMEPDDFYGEVVQTANLPTGQIPAGLGLHYAFRFADRLMVAELWQTRRHFDNFQADYLGPALTHVIQRYKIKGDPDFAEVVVLGAEAPDQQIASAI